MLENGVLDWNVNNSGDEKWRDTEYFSEIELSVFDAELDEDVREEEESDMFVVCMCVCDYLDHLLRRGKVGGGRIIW